MAANAQRWDSERGRNPAKTERQYVLLNFTLTTGHISRGVLQENR